MKNSKSLYDHVMRSLIQGIAEEKYRTKIPPEVKLAEEFEVSVPTIKKAMRPLVKKGIVTRIPGKGTFVKDQKKAKLLMEECEQHRMLGFSEKPKIVGVILPALNDAFSHRLLKGMTQALSTHNAHALLGISQNDRTQESAIIQNFLSSDVDGLIIFPAEGEIYNEDIVKLSLGNFPIVLVDRWLPGIDVSRVVSEHAHGTELAVEYLYELGHRNISLVSVSSDFPLTTQSIVQRKTGFIQSLEKLGLDTDDSLIWMDKHKDNVDYEQNLTFIIEKIRNRPDLTALIGISGDDTRLILEATKRLGMKVPEEVSVIGFDIGNEFSDYDPIFLKGGDASRIAWLDQSEHLIGKEGANLVCRLIKEPGNKEVVEIPIELRSGKSCVANKVKNL